MVLAPGPNSITQATKSRAIFDFQGTLYQPYRVLRLGMLGLFGRMIQQNLNRMPSLPYY